MAKLLHIFYHKEGTFSLLCQQVQYFTLSIGHLDSPRKCPHPPLYKTVKSFLSICPHPPLPSRLLSFTIFRFLRITSYISPSLSLATALYDVPLAFRFLCILILSMIGANIWTNSLSWFEQYNSLHFYNNFPHLSAFHHCIMNNMFFRLICL